uniref:RRM domain-containing protein n=1 Tax=Mucochytrium quahogii TaxID=96639 RepID=A0A7S2RXV7_9STRA|mmetsp:Transcript_50/g.127  ORF Transcript_50/g.127 Transcript_50/m.127 type:complete len:222 (+) Transcript_50:130-795(+)|eukprot:CAMPEP_0203777928 /NCGR_PEP_ID=MMETSP0099_2-20121227/7683_1 /ASSEMBLY_ACC=CAM_ASM_000209 /TAXON_ID=96639 /ORGANISM=" , Strain NY0313808BC1" /LENGTH=221 /DNA_ID=CAMNT_0050677319 /DNA_START=77 /DNA_END=742 /DNA_ORIENTATION=-
MDVPSHTLYIRNLNEKINAKRLKLLLYTTFSRFGNVLDIVCVKNLKLRGQAWVIFEEIVQATEAKKAMHDRTLFGKAMDIQYAKTKSDVIARLDGTYVPRPKRKLDGAQGPTSIGPSAAQKTKTEKTVSKNNPVSNGHTVKAEEPPHNILFVTELPAECEKTALEILFKQYNGYKEVRVVPSRNVAFIEFDTIPNATLAKLGLSGFKVSETHTLKLDFAKQ